MPVRVTDLTEADIPGAVSAIQEAFADDPYNNWVFDKSKFNPQRNAASLGIRCRWGMRNGIFQVAKEEGNDEVLGVAMWLKPQRTDQPISWHDWFEGWRLWFNQIGMNLWYGRGGLIVKVGRVYAEPFVYQTTIRRQLASYARSSPFLFLPSSSDPLLTEKPPRQRYYIWKEAQAKVQSHVWTDPRGYYFLNIMVVVPGAQGRGIGRQMMRTVTDRADAEGVPCYLESSRDEPNVRIYGRFGFRFAAELECDDNGDAIRLFAMVREPGAGLQSQPPPN
ncbi:hypothetical protein DL767_005897 [Monosporascus sp. MG133]|nr:hypothetical protein DL767_005897 [Monosporascus sp. MG133]